MWSNISTFLCTALEGISVVCIHVSVCVCLCVSRGGLPPLELFTRSPLACVTFSDRQHRFSSSSHTFVYNIFSSSALSSLLPSTNFSFPPPACIASEQTWQQYENLISQLSWQEWVHFIMSTMYSCCPYFSRNKYVYCTADITYIQIIGRAVKMILIFLINAWSIMSQIWCRQIKISFQNNLHSSEVILWHLTYTAELI